MMEAKPIWQSRTFWVNAISLVLTLLPPVQEFLNSVGMDTVVFISITNALNIGLRILTGKPVKVL
jgi:hypothetical protein